ncbi:UNVERIFIED_CONTAM: hypothetical protein H355_001086 [Colinus virginianus]|nr:hypothetical protein H355_001086 [Colinus virginianus]
MLLRNNAPSAVADAAPAISSRSLCVATALPAAAGAVPDVSPSSLADAPAVLRLLLLLLPQGGDFVKGDGTGCLSIYGSSFDDEPFVLPHFRSGLLSMANSGPNSNGCQFFITCNKCSWLDGKHVVFGQVLGSDSMQVVRKIEHVTVDGSNKPRVPVAITQCGEL